MPFDAAELTVTTTFPVEAPEGTVTPIPDAPQVLTVRLAPFSVAVEPPWDDPNANPLIVKVAPMLSEAAERLAIVGVEPCGTASLFPLPLPLKSNSGFR